ncbi:DMT family transporter [Mesorhizobium sp. B2-4-12]|nr:DMT family transporter [Mesorhizobium sp. B2-4-17]TPK93705.1 DMT family transporter [Mesorhizobium sp. B2-4-12]TPL02631.1 DMT family transporter [Mesorhizobium sp. B2-4-14]
MSRGSVVVERQEGSLSRAAQNQPGSRLALAFAAGAVALWATNALVGKALLASHPVSLVQCLQFCGATMVFALIRLIGAARQPAMPRHAGLVAVLAPFVVGFVGLVGTMILQYVAFASMSVIEANLVAYTWPLMVAAAVIAFESPQRPTVLGLAAALGFAGVVLVISGGRDHSWFQGNLVGYLAAFGSALCMAFYSILVGRLAMSADRLLLPSSLIGVAVTLLWCVHDGATLPAAADLALGLYLGAGPMGLGYYFWSRALKLEGHGKVAVVAYLTPIASTLLLIFSGERLTMTAVAGAVLVIGSCIAVGVERSEAENHV